MNEENIFVIGGQVTGDSFIGRKKMITEFRNELIYGKNRRVYSLVGLARSGKTSFVKEIFNVNLPENTFYCYQDISLDTTYFSIWYNVLNALKDFLEFDYKSSDISSTDGIRKNGTEKHEITCSQFKYCQCAVEFIKYQYCFDFVLFQSFE